jgi:integrase/recombinase XerD
VARVTAMLSFYRYHADVRQVPVAGRLYRMSSHDGRRPVPLLTPRQVEAIVDGCARRDPASGQWWGSVRDRLLFAALAEKG